MRSTTFSMTALVVGLIAVGCPASDDGDTGNISGSIGTGDSGTDSASASVTATEGMTSMGSASVGTDGSGGSGSDGGSSSGGGEPKPDGANCMDNAECESGMCFYIELIGGVCGECLSDADCPAGGCSLPNPLATPPVGAHCNMGEEGQGCMTDEVCQDGLFCATILEVPGIFTAATCSQCLTDADCTDGMLCQPTYDVLNISGERTCVMPGTVPNGQGCDFAGAGDMACMSGVCAMVDIMMLLQLGVCGDCEVDADCTMPEVCLDPDIDIMTGEVTAPTCGAA